MRDRLKAPFPWFGGKSRVADIVWPRFGDVPNYIEPFFGSGAMLLGRPTSPTLETVNDLDGFVANFWRAIAHDPEAVAAFADNPVFENDLHARHAWLVGQKEALPAKLEGDPDFFDAKLAGWWCWGICCWIGSGFCSGQGPWGVEDGKLVHLGDKGQGVNRKLVHLGDKGQGVNRKLVHLGDKGRGINGAVLERKGPHLMHAGKGVNRKRQRLTEFAETGCNASNNLVEWFDALARRLRRVRVCCGDWSRICGPSVTVKQGVTAVFLDPPYADTANRTADLYREDSGDVAHEVRRWAITQGSHKLMRIALCGYEGEHEMPNDWECVAWKTPGGYGSQSNGNAARERIWFSPHCLPVDTQRNLFEVAFDAEVSATLRTLG